MGWRYPIVEGADMGEITVRTGDAPRTATVQFYDADGNAVDPDQTPTWASSDENVATASAGGDGLTAEVSFVGPGSAIIECSTEELADDSTPTTVRATGMVNVDSPDVDAVTGEVTFSEAGSPPEGAGV
jgi:hypothetical protein